MVSGAALVSFMSLPDEVHLKIMNNLSGPDLLEFGQVSKNFRQVSNDENLWENMLKKDFKISILINNEKPISLKLVYILLTKLSHVQKIINTFDRDNIFVSLEMQTKLKNWLNPAAPIALSPESLKDAQSMYASLLECLLKNDVPNEFLIFSASFNPKYVMKDLLCSIKKLQTEPSSGRFDSILNAEANWSVTLKSDIKIGMTALTYLVWKNNLEMVKLLCQAGASANLKDSYSNASPTEVSVMTNNVQLFELLLSYKGKANSFKDNEKNLLMYAAERNLIDIMKMILDRKADVNKKNYNGYSALMFAGIHGNKDAAVLLCKNGASVNAVNNDGENAAYLARTNGYLSCSTLIQSYAPKNNTQTSAKPPPKLNSSKGYRRG